MRDEWAEEVYGDYAKHLEPGDLTLSEMLAVEEFFGVRI